MAKGNRRCSVKPSMILAFAVSMGWEEYRQAKEGAWYSHPTRDNLMIPRKNRELHPECLHRILKGAGISRREFFTWMLKKK